MNSVFSNLNISLIDLLSVLLPVAAVLCFMNQISVFQIFFNQILSAENEWISGIIYFSAAYFMGYVIYVASSFLDA